MAVRKRETVRRTDSAVVTVAKWAGRVAFLLSVAVGIGWAASLVIGTIRGTVSTETASILSTIGGVLAGGIAAYLGNSMNNGQHDTQTQTRATDNQQAGDTPNG